MTRVCYWSPDYIPSEPFCKSSRMTEQETALFLSFQAELAVEKERNFFDALSNGRQAFRFSTESEGFSGAMDGTAGHEAGQNRPEFTKKSATVAGILKKIQKNYVFSLEALSALKSQKSWVLYNIPTIAGVPAKTTFNKRDFLSR